MAISTWVHHLSLHVPLVLPAVLVALGALTWREESPKTRAFLHITGWLTLLMATIAVIAGVLSAPGWLGGEGSVTLRDHRDLGITAWCVIACAATSYSYGQRHAQRDLRQLGLCLWGVATLAVIGAGHWGGLNEHPKDIPF